MRNIRNLGSKGSLMFKLKTTHAPSCVQSIGLKAAGIFVILLSLDAFESDSPEKKSQTITS